MNLKKTDLKLVPSMINGYQHVNPFVASAHNSTLRNLTSSPTFPKVVCANAIQQRADNTHIFHSWPYASSSHPLPSFDEEEPNMNMSIFSSASRGSWTAPSTEKVRTGFGSSVGLPSQYPLQLHRKNNSSMTSCTYIDDDLEDFEYFFNDASPKSSFYQSTSKLTVQDDLDPMHPLKEETNGVPDLIPEKPKHRRQISTGNNQDEVVRLSNRQRRQRNQALGAKDFHEKILVNLIDDFDY